MKYLKKNMENKKVKSLKLWFFILFLAFGLLYSAIPQINMEVEASTQQLNTKKKTLKVGKDYQLTIENCKTKVKWSSSNKSVATVNTNGVVKAKKKGTAVITAKVGKNKFKCKIYVIGKNDYNTKLTEKKVREGIGIPTKATIKIEYGNKFYWEAGERYLVYVTVYGIGKYEGYYAGASFDVSEGYVCTDTSMWHYENPYTMISNEYTIGNYKYYFAYKGNDYDTLILFRSKKNGDNKKILCKTKNIDFEMIDIEGHYKGTIYFTAGFASSGSRFCTFNIKTKEFKQTKYPGVGKKISDTKYILDESGYYGDWGFSSTYVFNAATGKYKLLAKYCDGFSVFGNDVIYLKSASASYKTHSATVYRYNLKTNRTTKLKKISKIYRPYMIQSNFMTYYAEDQGELKICSFDTKVSKLSDGNYHVLKDVYAHVSDGYLDIYGTIKKNSSTKKFSYKHYRFKLSDTCKFYAIEDGIKGGCDIELFNQIHDTVYDNQEWLFIDLDITIKNGKVTTVTMSN